MSGGRSAMAIRVARSPRGGKRRKRKRRRFSFSPPGFQSRDSRKSRKSRKGTDGAVPREFRDGKTGATKTTYLELLEVDAAVAVLVLERKLLRDEVLVVAVVFHDAQVHEQRGKLILEFGDVRGRRELSAIRACGDRDVGAAGAFTRERRRAALRRGAPRGHMGAHPRARLCPPHAPRRGNRSRSSRILGTLRRAPFPCSSPRVSWT